MRVLQQAHSVVSQCRSAALLRRRLIYYLIAVMLGSFVEIVLEIAVVGREQPVLGENAIVTAGPCARTVVQTASTEVVIGCQRTDARKSGGKIGRVSKHGALELMIGPQVVVQFAGIIERTGIQINGAETAVQIKWLAIRPQCTLYGPVRLHVGWIEAAIEEQLVLEDIAAQVTAEIVTAGAHNASAWTSQQRISIRASGLQPVRLEVGVGGTMKLVAAALGDNVDHSAESFAVLRFKAAGLDLHLLDEVEVYTTAQRPEIHSVGAEAAISRVGYVRAVDDVLILQAGSAVDRRIRHSRAAPVCDARSHQENCRHR